MYAYITTVIKLREKQNCERMRKISIHLVSLCFILLTRIIKLPIKKTDVLGNE